MKKIVATLLLAVSLFLVYGCKKDDQEIVRIQSVVPQKIIDDLKAKGMLINDGINPPDIQNAYRMSPWTLQSPYGPDDPWSVGRVINDYYYKFYDQNEKNEIKYDYHNNSSDEGIGAGAFIAGEGQKFTIFSEESGEASGVTYKNVTIMSGELSSNGIKNFQYAFVIKEKTGDNNNSTLIPVETGRLWYDADFLSEKTTSFRKSLDNKLQPTELRSAQGNK